jgi:hypothetical protein
VYTKAAYVRKRKTKLMSHVMILMSFLIYFYHNLEP